MKVEIKKLKDSTLEITGEISAAEFDNAYGQALKEYQTKVQVPGFRPGHVPEKQLIAKIGENVVLERAADIAMQKQYPKIIEENKIEAIGHPQVVITKIAKGNPLGFKLITAVMPEIKLPDYKKIASEVMVEKAEIKVEEKEVQDSLEYLRKARAKQNIRPVSPDKDADQRDPQEEKGSELPELNDKFAKSLGNFNTLNDLKTALRQNIQFDKEAKEKERKRIKTLEEIIKAVQIDVPETMVEGEKEKMLLELRSSIENMGLNWSEYLTHLKKSEEDLKKDWQEDAEKRIKFGLLLKRIAQEEDIKVEQKEVEEHVQKMLSGYPEEQKAKLDQKRMQDYSYGIIRNEKVFQLLESQTQNI